MAKKKEIDLEQFTEHAQKLEFTENEIRKTKERDNSAHSFTEGSEPLIELDREESPVHERTRAKIEKGVDESRNKIDPVINAWQELKQTDAGFKWFTCPTCDGRGSVPQSSVSPSIGSQEEQREQLASDIQHISDSGANVRRLIELFERRHKEENRRLKNGSARIYRYGKAEVHRWVE